MPKVGKVDGMKEIAAFSVVVSEAIDGMNYYTGENFRNDERIDDLMDALRTLGVKVFKDSSGMIKRGDGDGTEKPRVV